MLAIEPFLTTGATWADEGDDGWTLLTPGPSERPVRAHHRRHQRCAAGAHGLMARVEWLAVAGPIDPWTELGLVAVNGLIPLVRHRAAVRRRRRRRGGPWAGRVGHLRARPTGDVDRRRRHGHDRPEPHRCWSTIRWARSNSTTSWSTPGRWTARAPRSRLRPVHRSSGSATPGRSARASIASAD